MGTGDDVQGGAGGGAAPAAVEMYTTATCPYCIRAEALLKARGVEAIAKVRVDLEPDRRAEMVRRSGRRTVPQIYIDGRHVGGYDDLAALDRAGGLRPLLDRREAPEA